MIPYITLPIVGWLVLWALLRIFKVKGLRSYRGLVLFLTTLLGLVLAWLSATIFVPLSLLVIFIVELALLKTITRLAWTKSFLIAALYTLAVLAVWLVVIYVSISWTDTL